MEIGAIIKKRRTVMKLTQEEFAGKLNVTPQAVSRWENEISLPDISLVPRIADILKLSCDDLLREKENRITHYALAGGIMIDASEVLIQNDIDVLFGYSKENEKNDRHLVLHADDADFLRNVVKDILSSQGYEVLQAKDGEECIDILSRNQVDILLLDINMPGNGLVILEEVKKTYPDLPVLMLSAMADDQTVKKTLALGANGFVVKPFGAEDLIEHLKYV
ncbi:MAG: response regulator [Acetatifactor sp.]